MLENKLQSNRDVNDFQLRLTMELVSIAKYLESQQIK